ncbi:MAG: hypothetical protein AAGA80_06535 [Cyanobacteria bacterium P01_F01_bin.143]
MKNPIFASDISEGESVRRAKKHKNSLAIFVSATLYFLLKLTPPVLAGDAQLGGIKPTKKAFNTMVTRFTNLLSYNGSLSSYNRLGSPKIDFLFPSPRGKDRTPKCGNGEIAITITGYCPNPPEIFLILSRLNNQEYDDHYVTQAVTDTNILSAYMIARLIGQHATSTLDLGFENYYQQSLLHDCFAGEILGKVYAPSGDLSTVDATIANDLSRFMNLGLERHSGGDSNLAANKRAAFEFGFNPANSCLNYTPPTNS